MMRRAGILPFVVGSIIALIGAPAAASGVDATVAIDVSWTRVGSDAVMTPPASLRVGDEVTIDVVATGTSGSLCQTGLTASDGRALHIVSLPAIAGTTCLPWTFILPPTPAGPMELNAAVSGAPTDSQVIRAALTLTVEDGGVARPFASNYPHASWAAAEVFGSAALSFGANIHIATPDTATAACQFTFNGIWLTGFRVGQPTCDGWDVTLPEMRPPAFIGGSAGHAWTGIAGISADGVGPDGRRIVGGTYTTEISIDGDGSARTFESSLPAVLFTAEHNPFFRSAGSAVLTPTLVGIGSGTCEYKYRTYDIVGFLDGPTVPVVDGACAPLVIDATSTGGYQVDVTVRDTSGHQVSQAWHGFEVVEPIPDPVIDLPDEVPADTPVEIDVAVDAGAPVSYEIDVAGATSERSPITTATADVTCSGMTGRIDAAASVRSASATCSFPAGASYVVTGTMVDALGNVRSTTREVVAASSGDVTAPTVTAPRHGFLVPSSVSSAGRIGLRLTWTGADAGAGIARYELAQRVDGGTWVTVATNLTSPTATRSVLHGHRYAFRVRGIDRAGNVSPWAQGTSTTVSRFQESSRRVTYAGTWRTTSSPSFLGGAARRASSAGAKASITFTGRSIAWVARKGPDRGRAAVFVNGIRVATVNLYAPSYQNRRVVWTGRWTSANSRKVTIRVLGTSGRPRVDLDAIYTSN